MFIKKNLKNKTKLFLLLVLFSGDRVWASSDKESCKISAVVSTH